MITMYEIWKLALLGTFFALAYKRLTRPKTRAYEIERIIKL